MRDILEKKLQELNRLSKGGASERTLETRIVLLLEYLGWSSDKIRQDVTVTAKDRADIVVQADDSCTVLIEVKVYGEFKDAREQTERYCKLLRPRLALLTDGDQWHIFYVGKVEITRLYTGEVESNIEGIIDYLLVITQERFNSAKLSERFSMLDSIDDAFSRLNNEDKVAYHIWHQTTIASFLRNAESVQPISDPSEDLYASKDIGKESSQERAARIIETWFREPGNEGMVKTRQQVVSHVCSITNNLNGHNAPDDAIKVFVKAVPPVLIEGKQGKKKTLKLA